MIMLLPFAEQTVRADLEGPDLKALGGRRGAVYGR